MGVLQEKTLLAERGCNNNFTELKGGASDYERAGRKAYDNSLERIVGKIVRNIEK